MKVVRSLGFCALVTAAASGCSFLMDDDFSSGFDGGSSGGGSSGSSGKPGPWGRPAEGVYSYAPTGTDRIRNPIVNFDSTYGPTAKITVRYDGGSCFTLTVDLRKGYEEAMHMCVAGADVVQDSSERSQDFAGIGATTEQTCTPGDVYLTRAPSAGQVWNHDCNGKNVDTKSGDSRFETVGKYSFAGNESIAVGGREIGVMHYHDERDVSGSQTGTNVADWYFASDTGLLVRLVRHIDVKYQAPIVGLVNYVETVDMTLSSMSPSSLAPLPDAGADASTDDAARGGAN